MKKLRMLGAFGLAVCISGGAGFAGARALAAAEKKTHFEADAAELSRSEAHVHGHLTTAVQTMKRIAQETTAENAEPNKEAREKALEATLKPLQEDSLTLLVQAHLLSLDSIADKSGEPAELFIQENVYKKLGVEAAEVAKRRETTGLGHGGLVLGYMIAKVSKTPADQVFAGKADHSWPEVMRTRKVTAADIVRALEGGL